MSIYLYVYLQGKSTRMFIGNITVIFFCSVHSIQGSKVIQGLLNVACDINVEVGSEDYEYKEDT